MVGTLSFDRMEMRTLKDQVVLSLRTAIISGKINAGERLNEMKLARDFGVSRISVREALQQLQEQGLLSNVSRRGKFVVSLSEEEIQKINSLRLILQAEALRLSRAEIAPKDVQCVEGLVRKMEHCPGAPEIDAAAMDLRIPSHHLAMQRQRIPGEDSGKLHSSAVCPPSPLESQLGNAGMGTNPGEPPPQAAALC